MVNKEKKKRKYFIHNGIFFEYDFSVSDEVFVADVVGFRFVYSGMSFG